MPKNQTRKYITTVKLKDSEYGLAQRKSYAKTILKDAPVFPKPLGYEDIDKSFYDFIDSEVDLVIKGKKVPTYTLYSNQRFTEYSQTWEHTDEEGNLQMDFKTVSRESNPKPGSNQGGLWNIPGDQRYTLLMRSVSEDNGSESYEIYSMGQPYCVDLEYKVSFITDMFENLNRFNEKINSLFKARQCYIRPNGHFIPMVLEEVNDNTEYTISDRKFYNQTVVIKVMAYIINKEDFKVEKKPKRAKMFMEGDKKRPKPEINIDEYQNGKIGHPAIELTIDFKEWHDKVEFTIDTDFVVETTETYNIRNMRLSANDVPFFTDKGFKLKDGDNVKIFIKHVDIMEKSQIKFIGYNPSVEYVEGELPLDVKDDIVKGEDIVIE